MSEEVKAKVKALFPENVEGIYISKNDYDRLYGDLTLENIELKQEIERLNNIIKEQGLEDKPNYYVKGLEGCLKEYQEEIDELNNIINEFEKELIKKIEAVKTIKNMLGEGAYVVNPHIDLLEQEYNYFYKKLQELKGSDKE